jgi:hypothetical protein
MVWKADGAWRKGCVVLRMCEVQLVLATPFGGCFTLIGCLWDWAVLGTQKTYLLLFNWRDV